MSFIGSVVRPMIFLEGTSNNSLGGSTSGTKGTLATFRFLWAKYILKGVFEVLDIPINMISAFIKPLGSFPSSYLTANSIASTFLKYFSSNFLIKPASLLGVDLRMLPISLTIDDIISILGILF